MSNLPLGPYSPDLPYIKLISVNLKYKFLPVVYWKHLSVTGISTSFTCATVRYF